MQVPPPTLQYCRSAPPPRRPHRLRVLEAPGATFTWHLQIWGTPCLPPPPALSLLGFLSRTQSLLYVACCAVRLVAPSCLTLCNPMDCSPPGSSVHGDSQVNNTAVGCRILFQGNLPNPGIKPRSPALQADSLPSESKGLRDQVN